MTCKHGPVVFICWLATALFTAGCTSHRPAETSLHNGHFTQTNTRSVSYEANIGQAPPDVRYLAHNGRATGLLTDSELRFVAEQANNSISVRFTGERQTQAIDALNRLPVTSNYFIGDNPDNWLTTVPHYQRLRYREVFPGIDMEFSERDGAVVFDYLLAPGSDPGHIRLAFDNSEKLEIREGRLVAHHAQGQLLIESPVIYQDHPNGRLLVPGHFVLQGDNVAGFNIGHYDRDHTLVIDPVITWSTYAGGSGDDRATSIARDAAGNVYLAGTTNSSDFPLLAPFQSTVGAVASAYVMKFDGVTHNLVYSTYIGDSVQEARAITVDASGIATIGGSTSSTTWPLQNPLQTGNGGSVDAFVSRLNSSGNGLVFSTYLGGVDIDRVRAMALDPAGRLYLTGPTASADFPLQNPMQSQLLGFVDSWVARIDSGATQLEYSTFLGGTGNDYGAAIAADANGKAYLTGFTTSSDFPTVSPVQGSNAGGNEAWVTCLASNGTIQWSTYFGGSGTDNGNGISLTSAGNVLVAGQTLSSDMPVTNALQSSNNGSTDAFLLMLDNAGSTIQFSTYLGGSGSDTAVAIAVDSNDTAFVTGTTTSTDFPVANATQSVYGGSPVDAWVARINPSTPAVVYATYLGGNNEDRGRAIAADAQGNAWVAGLTRSTDFPLAAPYQASNAGQTDLFVSALSFSGALTQPDGDINVDGSVTPADLLLGYRIVRGEVTPSAAQLQHGDVAPFISGTSIPDGAIRINDLLLIQRKLSGYIVFP